MTSNMNALDQKEGAGDYITCPACDGSGLAHNMAGEPDMCRICMGNTVVPARAAGERETAWAIENRCMSPMHYFCGGKDGQSFSPDHADAVRFSRKEDAERCLNFFVRAPVQGCCEVHEHVWLTPEASNV